MDHWLPVANRLAVRLKEQNALLIVVSHRNGVVTNRYCVHVH
jgi:hypothetical protein